MHQAPSALPCPSREFPLPPFHPAIPLPIVSACEHGKQGRDVAMVTSTSRRHDVVMLSLDRLCAQGRSTMHTNGRNGSGLKIDLKFGFLVRRTYYIRGKLGLKTVL